MPHSDCGIQYVELNERQNTGTNTQPSTRSESEWLFTTIFAVLGLVLGGLVVFYSGYRQAFPPPPPPGTGGCGLAFIGGLLGMFVGAPLAAITSAIVTGALGIIVDSRRTRSRRGLRQGARG